jgi:uncharacterized protein YtpQ (UPF0354 family)
MSLMSAQNFAIMAANALIEGGVDRQTLSFDPDKFDLVVKDGRGEPVNTVHLASYYARFKATSETEVHERIFKQIKLHAQPSELPSTLDEAASQLRITIRLKWFFENDMFPQVNMGDHLCAVIAYDMPESMLFVTHETLEMWEANFDEVFDIAQANLEHETTFEFDTYANKNDSEDRAHFFSSEDAYGAGRAIFTAQLASLPVRGETLVAIPIKDRILITGSECSTGLEDVLSAIKELQQQPGDLCPILMHLKDDCYLPYKLPKDHQLWRDYRILELEFIDWLYGSQVEKLQEEFDGISGRITYISHKFDSDRSEPTSICFIAPEFIPCSIPKTDYVIFGNREGPFAICTRQKLEVVLAEKLLRINSYPVRYEINEFPSEAILEMLGFDSLPE